MTSYLFYHTSMSLFAVIIYAHECRDTKGVCKVALSTLTFIWGLAALMWSLKNTT